MIISSRNEKELEKVKSECAHPEKVTILKLDVSQPLEVLEQTEKLVQSLESSKKKIDIVVENAGIIQSADLINQKLEDHLYLTNVNYNGPIAHIKGLLSHLKKNRSG